MLQIRYSQTMGTLIYVQETYKQIPRFREIAQKTGDLASLGMTDLNLPYWPTSG
jgi:hypothetical protein